MRLRTTIALCCMLAIPIVFATHPNPRPKAPAIRYPASPASARAIREAKKWTVLISNEGWGGVSRGTGVLLDPTHVLTCAHVIDEDTDKMLVYFYPGYVLAHGKAVYKDASLDLAVVEIDVPVHADAYAWFTTKHEDGEPITIIGNAEGSMEWFVSYGMLSGENKRDLMADCSMFHGDSGGPWIDSEGNVVAISAWGIPPAGGSGSWVYGGVASHTVRDFLVAYMKSKAKR